MTETFGHFIDGEERESLDGARFDSVDPYTQETWANAALGGAPEADLAVSAARKAFDEGPWPRMGVTERSELLHNFADVIEAHADELSLAETRDMGKPTAAVKGGDVRHTVDGFRFYADHARLATAEVLPMDTGHHTYTRYEPAGVVAAVAPWNYPMMLGSSKVAPALAWGNTVVLKPAEDTPATATILARLAVEAGIPPGVFNVLQGYGPASAGSALTEDPRVDRITFTGESNTGRIIAGAAARNLTPVSLELGGKGANLVFADADLDKAVDWSIKGIFNNSGQICIGGSRIYVQRPILDEFLARLVAAAEQLTLGDPKNAGTQLGPLSSQGHYEKVLRYVDHAASGGGGKMLTGGPAGGWFIKPTIVSDVPAGGRLQREEIFGPVVTVTPFDTEPDAIRAANDTPYGLSALVFTENLSRAHRVARQLRAGTVWTNCCFVKDPRAPFGGVGDSGLGREGGTFSRDFFTEPKAVTMAIEGVMS